jgi:transposase-like protein
MYLLRNHDVTISSSGIWRILKKLNMNRLPRYQRYKRHDERWKRYEKPEPGHRIQMDVKFLERTSREVRRRSRVIGVFPTVDS